MPEVLQLTMAALLGLAAGSFVNAYVWRVHNKQAEEDRDKDNGEVEGSGAPASKTPVSVMNGRSMCPDCGHQLAPRDLVPVVSWLMLRGKCRYCSQKISPQYPMVELATLIVFIASVAWWPFAVDNLVSTLILLMWLGIVTQFIALSLYDLKWYLLPDNMVAILFLFVVILRLLEAVNGAEIGQWLLDAVLGGGLAFILFYGLFAAGKGRWMGGGDVKLVLVLGLLLGLGKTLLGLFLAFNIAALSGLALIVLRQRSRQDRVPFGPFLILGAWLAVLFGDNLIEWYLSLSGL